LEAQRQLEGLG